VKHGILYALAAAAMPFATAHAAEHESTEEIIITAPTGDFLQPTQVLEGRELLLRKSTTLGETLANEPGINASAYGKGASRPVIRGQAGPRVQVLKDNIATLDVSALSPDHNPTVEPLLIERVEIVRGPATLAYGSAAAGGVVNVIEGRIPSDAEAGTLSGAIEVRGDTVAESKAFVGRLDGVAGRIGWHVDATSGDSDDYDIAGFATADPAERPGNEPEGTQPNSDTEFDSYSAGASFLSDNGFTGVSISQYETVYGLVGPESDITGGPFIDMEETRVDIRGEYALDGFINNIRFGLGVNDYEHSENEPDGEIATLFDNEEWEARVEVGHDEIAGMSGVIGLQLNDRDLVAAGEEAFVPDSEAERWGVFIIEDFETEIGSFQFGARADSAEFTNADFADYDETAFSFAAGFRRGFAGNYEGTLNFSYAERNPDVEELYSNGLHIATNQVEIGLLAQGLPVDTEVAYNFDVGVERFAGRLQWSAKLFYTQYYDYVYQRIDGQVEEDGEFFDQAFYTQDDADFFGGEAELSYALVQDASYGLGLRVFGDFVEAELDDGSDLPRIPPARVGVGLEYSRDNWFSDVRVTYHAEQDSISSFNTDSYTMLDWDVFYTIPGDELNWELFFRGTNLLDEEARASTSFVAAFSQLPGRNFSAGARLKF